MDPDFIVRIPAEPGPAMQYQLPASFSLLSAESKSQECRTKCNTVTQKRESFGPTSLKEKFTVWEKNNKCTNFFSEKKCAFIIFSLRSLESIAPAISGLGV